MWHLKDELLYFNVSFCGQVHFLRYKKIIMPELRLVSVDVRRLLHFVATVVDLACVPRPDNGAGQRDAGHRRVLSSFYTCSKRLRKMWDIRPQCRLLYN